MKIIISDIDSSLSDLNNEDLMKSLKIFLSKGNKFIIATSKAINYVADILSLSDLIAEYYICNDGAAIFDKYFNILYRKDLKQNIVRPIYQMLEDDSNILETYVDTSHGFVTDTKMVANGLVARPINDTKAEILLNNITLKYPNVHGHISDNMINIIDIEASKKNAIDFLEQDYRLNTSNVYVLGRDNSDLELMEKYNGYVLKDSSLDLKKYSKGEVKDLKELVDLVNKEDETKDLEELETIYL